MLKLLSFLKPFRPSVALVLALALAQSLASLYLPRLMADIVDHGIVPDNRRQIMIYGGLMLLMALVSTAASVGSSVFSAKVASGFGPPTTPRRRHWERPRTTRQMGDWSLRSCCCAGNAG